MSTNPLRVAPIDGCMLELQGQVLPDAGGFGKLQLGSSGGCVQAASAMGGRLGGIRRRQLDHGA